MDAPVFVFDNGCPDYVGLSLQKDGSNLPQNCNGIYEWRPTKRVAMSFNALNTLTTDSELAFLNFAPAAITSAARALSF